jgi:hypothetical protein
LFNNPMVQARRFGPFGGPSFYSAAYVDREEVGGGVGEVAIAVFFFGWGMGGVDVCGG